MKNRYFKILGLQPGATENEIRKNYRKLVMKYHPDKNDSPQAAKKFIEIKEAYEILTGKEEIQQVNRRQSKSTSQKNKAENKEERIKKAQKRYRDQVYQEHIENE